VRQNVAALDFIAQCLRPQPSTERRRALSAEIDGMRLGWESVVSLANEHFVTASLWAALLKSDASSDLPEDLQEYLAAIHRLNSDRNEQLKRQTSEVVGHMNRLGITPILLKGAAHLHTDTFDDGGARMMSDLDILVPEGELEIAWDGLIDAGYQPHPGTVVKYDVHHHLAPLVRPGEPAPIELHRQVLFTDRELVSAESARRSARTVAAGDLALQVLSPTNQVLQNFWHSEVDDDGYRRGILSIRYLHELVRLDANYSRDIDWSFIRHMVDARGMGCALEAYLYHAHRLLGLGHSSHRAASLSSRIHYARCRTCLRWDFARYTDERVQGVQYVLKRVLGISNHRKP
jgi:Uncharacterised nucleotidyltransferase